MYVETLFLTCLSLLAESWPIIWKIDYRIEGDITGVGFRNFTQIKARELGLRGYIRHNNYNSEGVIEGPRENIEKWKKFVRLGCGTDPPLVVYVVDYVMENTILKYTFEDFYVLPSVNMDDVEDSMANYMDYNESATDSAENRREEILNQQRRYKTFVRVEDLILHRIKVKLASRNFENQVMQDFLKLNTTYENIRTLYKP